MEYLSSRDLKVLSIPPERINLVNGLGASRFDSPMARTTETDWNSVCRNNNDWRSGASRAKRNHDYAQWRLGSFPVSIHWTRSAVLYVAGLFVRPRIPTPTQGL